MKALTVHMRSGPFLHEMGVKQQRGYPHFVVDDMPGCG